MSSLNGWTVIASTAREAACLKASGMGNYRHGARTKATIELWRFIKSLS